MGENLQERKRQKRLGRREKKERERERERERKVIFFLICFCFPYPYSWKKLSSSSRPRACTPNFPVLLLNDEGRADVAEALQVHSSERAERFEHKVVRGHEVVLVPGSRQQQSCVEVEREEAGDQSRRGASDRCCREQSRGEGGEARLSLDCYRGARGNEARALPERHRPKDWRCDDHGRPWHRKEYHC